MTVYSELGRGTTFRVYLPQTEQEASERAITPRPANQGQSESVLVIEDDVAVRAAMARVLRAEGYKVLEASGGAEALLLVEDVGDKLDLVITDVVMPRMSGLDLCDRIRRRFPDMAVLLVSGFAPRSLVQRGLGMQDMPFLAKPFSPGALVTAARRPRTLIMGHGRAAERPHLSFSSPVGHLVCMRTAWTVVALLAVACSGEASGDGDGRTDGSVDAAPADGAHGADAAVDRDAEVPPTGDAAMGDAGGDPEPEPCVGRMIDVAEGGDLTPAIEAAIGDGEVACLPEGRFAMSPLDLSGAAWQVTGAGIDRTVIVLPSGFHGFLMRLAGSDWQMGGMTIDVDSESDGWSTNAIPRFLLRGDDWRFHDLRLKGTTGPNGDAHEPVMNIQDVGAGATARFENVLMLDGSAPAGEGSNVSAYGAFSDWNVNGHLLFDRIQLSMWAENSLYVEGSHVTITDSFFHNTNVGVRIGGNTVVDNSVFLLDGPLPVQAWSGGSGMRGLWLNANAYYPGTIRVTNSDFTMTQAIVKGYSGASVDYIELENLTVVGNIDVLGDGVIRNSCVDGSVDGIATEGLRTGCSPRTTAP